MRKINTLILLFAVLVFSSLHAQDIKSLDERNGFKNFKLGSKYTAVYGGKAKEESGAEKVTITRTEEKIGEIPIKTIELFYLRDTLARIEIKISPENHAKLIEACKGAFGPATDDFCDNEETRKKKNENLTMGKYYRNQYKWKGIKVNLDYFYQYPIISSDPYAVKELYIAYSITDYAKRLDAAKKAGYSPKDF
jgi:hypothetical protein